MDVTGIIDGVKVTSAHLKELGQELGRDLVSLTVQEGRGLAVDLGRYTIPHGLNEGSGDRLKSRIESDLKQLFPSLDDGATGAFRVFELLERTSLKAAKAFWSAFKAGDREAMEEVLAKRISGLPRKIDRPGHKAARTGKGGRIPFKQRSLAVVRPGPRDNYIKKVQRRAGMAKAGWFHSAKALGGRVRRGGGRSGGTSETFPSWVRKAGARKKLGGASVTRAQGKIIVTLRNSVRHANEALPNNLMQYAESNAARRFEQALTKAAKYRARKFNRRSR